MIEDPLPPLRTVKCLSRDEEGNATLVEYEAEAHQRYHALLFGHSSPPDTKGEGIALGVAHFPKDEPRPVLEKLRTWPLGPVRKDSLQVFIWLRMGGRERWDAALTEESFAALRAWMNEP